MLAVLIASAGSQSGGDHHRLHSRLEECAALREEGNITGSANCMAEAVMKVPFPTDLLEYFGLSPPKATPESLKWARLPACDKPHFDWDLVKRVAVLWRSSKLGPCLWSNMLPHQLALIINLARAFQVTHIVECGRMGGLPLLHYTHFGYNVTSFELSPIPSVRDALAVLAPAVRQIDGDCVKGIPAHVEQLLASQPSARVGIILDGPKGYGVFQHANSLAEKAAFIVVDDQSPRMLALKGNRVHQPRWPYFDESSESPLHFESWMPTPAVLAAFEEGEKAPWMARPNGQSKANVKITIRSGVKPVYPYQRSDNKGVTQMIMLGGRWRWLSR